jgi:hypothetical protein
VSYSTMVRKERQTEKGGEEEKLFLGAIWFSCFLLVFIWEMMVFIYRDVEGLYSHATLYFLQHYKNVLYIKVIWKRSVQLRPLHLIHGFLVTSIWNLWSIVKPGHLVMPRHHFWLQVTLLSKVLCQSWPSHNSWPTPSVPTPLNPHGESEAPVMLGFAFLFQWLPSALWTTPCMHFHSRYTHSGSSVRLNINPKVIPFIMVSLEAPYDLRFLLLCSHSQQEGFNEEWQCESFMDSVWLVFHPTHPQFVAYTWVLMVIQTCADHSIPYFCHFISY